MHSPAEKHVTAQCASTVAFAHARCRNMCHVCKGSSRCFSAAIVMFKKRQIVHVGGLYIAYFACFA